MKINPKSKFLNPKQCPDCQNPNDQNKIKSFEHLRIRKFGFVSNSEF